MKRKARICFVDDDRSELERFKEVMKDRYDVGIGVVLDEALEDLGGRRPDFFLLDLVYGKAMPQGVVNAISHADEGLSEAEDRIRRMLQDAGQSADAGFELAERVQQMQPGVPRAFFSRKAFLKDALKAHQLGLPVLEKPDPDEYDKGTFNERYRSALERGKDPLASRINQMIADNRWWARNKTWARGFATSSFFFLLKIGWDLWKGGPVWAFVLVIFAIVFVLMVAVPRRK